MTIRRWIKHGVTPLRSSQRIYLQSITRGRRMLTTAKWLIKFDADCTAATETAPAFVKGGIAVPTHKQAMREMEAGR